MAGSRFEYVKKFEQDDSLLRDTYIVVRVDGRGFGAFTDEHGYLKPNDIRGLQLMNQAAADVMREWGEALLAYGQSDEYSFVFPRSATVFGRRAAKIATGIASLFAASFVFHWASFFPTVRLRRPPAFDARCVCYPSLRTVTDYFKWRQVDAHINCLYNETFWALVQQGGMTGEAAFAALRGSLSEDKHEILFNRFGIAYGRLPVLYRRGTALLRRRTPEGRPERPDKAGSKAGKGAGRAKDATGGLEKAAGAAVGDGAASLVPSDALTCAAPEPAVAAPPPLVGGDHPTADVLPASDIGGAGAVGAGGGGGFPATDGTCAASCDSGSGAAAAAAVVAAGGGGDGGGSGSVSSVEASNAHLFAVPCEGFGDFTRPRLPAGHPPLAALSLPGGVAAVHTDFLAPRERFLEDLFAPWEA